MNLLLKTEFFTREPSNKYSVNSRGRPKTEKLILFSEQPKSIVSQMLSSVKPVNDYGERINIKENKQHSLIQCERKDSLQINENTQETSNSKRHKLYVCDFTNCTYSCKFSSNLAKHKRIHTDEKRYLCDRCSFRTNFINSLKVHKRIHTTERPYHCKQCDYKCNSSSNLKKHCSFRHPGVAKSN